MARGKRTIEEQVEYQIKIYKEARNDIYQITKWYDLQVEGLGDKFEAMLNKAMVSLTNDPTAFAHLFDNVRRIRLKKFPYIVFYKVDKLNVYIFGVIHTKRNPSLIKERFRHLGL